MNHRAKVSYDTDQKRWTGACDCTHLWYAARWRDAFESAFTHVRGARRIAALGGIGFRIPERVLTTTVVGGSVYLDKRATERIIRHG